MPYRSRATVGLLSTPCSTPNSVTTISGFLSSSVNLHRRRTIAGKLLAFGFVAKILTTPCQLGLLPAAQNFLTSIWPLIEILRSLVAISSWSACSDSRVRVKCSVEAAMAEQLELASSDDLTLLSSDMLTSSPMQDAPAGCVNAAFTADSVDDVVTRRHK